MLYLIIRDNLGKLIELKYSLDYFALRNVYGKLSHVVFDNIRSKMI